MRARLDTWRRHRRDRPVATALFVLGTSVVVLACALAAVGPLLLAQFVAGLAVVPLSSAAALFLIPVRPWPSDGDDWRGPGGGPGDERGPQPSGGGPESEVDWERFERDFQAYVAQTRCLVAA